MTTMGIQGAEEMNEYIFNCSNCGEELEVNGSMRQKLIEKGCVICGADLDEDCFVDIDES